MSREVFEDEPLTHSSQIHKWHLLQKKKLKKCITHYEYDAAFFTVVMLKKAKDKSRDN